MELKNIRNRSTNNYDNEDLAQECAAYMKTKLFMAKRISEQQKEIEQLREEVFYHSMKHSQLYEIISSLNEQLTALRKSRTNSDFEKMDLSPELANSLIFEEERNDIVQAKAEKVQDDVIISANNLIIKETLLNENLLLRKDLELEKANSLSNTSVINKLVNDKYVLFTELNELLMSLKKVDLESMNNFYNASLQKSRSLSSVGLKYSILSAQCEIDLLLQPSKNLSCPLPEPIANKAININRVNDIVKMFEGEIANLCNEKILNK